MSWWQLVLLDFAFAFTVQTVEIETCYFISRIAVLRERTLMWARGTSSFAACAVHCSRDKICKGVAFNHKAEMCMAYGFSYPTLRLPPRVPKASHFSASCRDDGYELVPRFGMAFKLYRTKMSWGRARRVCREERGDLITLDNRPKDSFIKGKMEAVHNREFHVWTALRREVKKGRKKRDKKSDYRWPSGGHYAFRWNYGDPDFGKEHCCYIVRKGFADAECTIKHDFICERKMTHMTNA